jgi:serine/threonine protein kinase/peptidoglycan hydrolase-like protein with peptidoglycan-binding domain
LIDAKADSPQEGHDNDFVALPVGSIVGRYEITAVLGRGGFGITYRARDSQLNRDVAIKEYLPSALAVRQNGLTVLPNSTKSAEDFAWGRQRFVEEGRTLANLQRSPAIVRVHDFLEANGTAYIVMELAPGSTLAARLQERGPLAAAEIDRILWPLLDGLEKVHAAGFLHRDIKPANILLDDEGAPTLIDFGASRAAMADRTAVMTAIFTPGYAAAEQMTSARQGPWTDIYALSATLYHAITGAPPPNAVERMLEDEYQPLAETPRAGFSPGVLSGIDRGLAVRASDRPQSVEAWRAVLRRDPTTSDQPTVKLSRSAVVPRQAKAKKRGIGLWAGFAVLLLLVVGGGYYGFTSRFAPEATQAESTAPSADAIAKAQEAQRKAEQEAARLRADKEARDKAEAEAALRAQVEKDTRARIEAELAAQRQAEEEARLKAEADAKAKAEQADKASTETAETSLNLGLQHRQHIQVALTSLGFNTGGTDGIFGPRTREMIAAWQSRRGDPGTGFLSRVQSQALLRDAAPAIARFDDEQKKAEEEKSKAASTASPPPSAANVPSQSGDSATTEPTNAYDGDYAGAQDCSNGSNPLSMHVVGGKGSGSLVLNRCSPPVTVSYIITFSPDGSATLHARGYDAQCRETAGVLRSHIENGIIQFPYKGALGQPCSVNLARRKSGGSTPTPRGGGGSGGRHNQP